MGRPPKNTDREETPVLILRAATTAFAAHGYAGATLSNIAASVGIRRPSLLYHFPTKQALYDAVVRDAFLRVGGNLMEAVETAGATPAQRIALVVGAMTGFARHNSETIRIVVRELVDPSDVGGPLVRTGLGGLLDAMNAAAGQDPADGIDGREAIMALVSNFLLRTAAGITPDGLWAPKDHTMSLANRLLLRDPPSRSSTVE